MDNTQQAANPNGQYQVPPGFPAAFPQVPQFQQYQPPLFAGAYQAPVQQVPAQAAQVQGQQVQQPGQQPAQAGQIPAQQWTPQQFQAWQAQQQLAAWQAAQGRTPSYNQTMVLTQLPNGQWAYTPAPQQNVQANQLGQQNPYMPQQPVQPQQTYALELDANGMTSVATLFGKNGFKNEETAIRSRLNIGPRTGFDVTMSRNLTLGHLAAGVGIGVGALGVWEVARFLLKDKVMLPGLIKYGPASKR